MFYTYVLESIDDGKRYIGYSRDLKRCLSEHKKKMNQSTKYHLPLKLIYCAARQGLAPRPRGEDEARQVPSRSSGTLLAAKPPDAPDGHRRRLYYEACINIIDAKRRERYFKTTQGQRFLGLRLKECLRHRALALGVNVLGMPKISKHPRGAITLLVLLGVSVFSLMVLVSVSTLASHAFIITLDEAATEKTFYAAEAGLNEGLYRLVHNAVPGDINLNFNGVDVLVTIRANPLNPYQRVVTSRAEDATGKVRELEIIANTSSFAGGFDYAVQTGVGGVYMDNNSLVIGNIYSNGMVRGSAAADVAGNVTVANVASLDQVNLAQNNQFEFGYRVGPTNYTDVAQSFVPGTTGGLNKFAIMLRKIGNPGDLWWRVTADNGGKPATTKLAFGTIESDDVGSTLSWRNVYISTPVSVTAGTTYWLVLDASNNTANHWAVGIDSDSSYAAGDAYYTTSWTNGAAVYTPLELDSADFSFATWLGLDNTRLEYITVHGHAKANRITAAKVCGDAYYESITATAEDFLNNPTTQYCDLPSDLPLTPGTGFPNTPDPQPLPLPIRDGTLQVWKDEIDLAGNPVLTADPSTCPASKPSGFYCVETDGTLGLRKIDGDFYVGNGATLTLTGNLWVTGNIILDNNGTVRLDPSLGAGSAVIMADGLMDVSNNYVLQGSGDPHSFLLMVSTSDSLDPGNPAIYAPNNTDSIIFGSPNGVMKVKNNGQLNAAVAEQLYLEPNSTVTYNSNLIYFTVPAGSEEPVSTVLGTWREK